MRRTAFIGLGWHAVIGQHGGQQHGRAMRMQRYRRDHGP